MGGALHLMGWLGGYRGIYWALILLQFGNLCPNCTMHIQTYQLEWWWIHGTSQTRACRIKDHMGIAIEDGHEKGVCG